MGKSVSVSCGVTASLSWVLVHTRFCFAKSLFPQSSVSSGGSMVELMVTSSRRAYVIARSTAPRVPAPVQSTADPISVGDTQTLKGSSGSVSMGSLGPSAHKILFEPSEHLWRVWGLILKMISPLL